MYGKIFTSIYDGSLACGNWKALITFQQLIILADQDGVIDMTAIAIHRRTTIPLEIIEEGIMELLKPDSHSRNKTDDGRRIVLLDEDREWGWVIVNYEYYKNLASAAERREQNKQAQQRSRNQRPQASANVSSSHKTSAPKPHIDLDVHLDTDVDVDIKTPVPQAAQIAEIKDIFKFWKNTLNHPRSNLDDKRKALIRKHLKSGYSVDDLKSAINGCSNTPHNMGDNDRGQVYDSIELILRDSGQIDRFMRNDSSPPSSRGQAGKRLNANIEAAKSIIGDLK
ncbi:hypothetical protein KA005_17505 [bacterium]|nr:hypothetical protein [bacterium]